MKEFAWIEKIRSMVSEPNPEVEVGIGDDAAVLNVGIPNRKLLVTTDSLYELVHFDLAYTLPEELGHKALAVNLSDIAAMGGTPKFALVSLGIRDGIDDAFVESFYKGMHSLAHHYGVSIVGGNISRSVGSLNVDVTLIGTANKPVLRSGAREGDRVFLIGKIGESARGLKLLQTLGRERALTEDREAVKSHLMPNPEVEAGVKLGQLEGVTSLIDVSDGLASELHHLSRASRVGFEVAISGVPDGEDYALLGTCAPTSVSRLEKTFLRRGTGFAWIGFVTQDEAVCRVLPTGEKVNLAPAGWIHHVNE